jgi:copper(I)-binding protein
MNTKTFLIPALFCLALQAQAQVTVEQAWARATVAQQKAGGAFLRLKSVQDSRLVEVRAALAGHVEMHEMAMVGDTMKMREVEAVDLPAGQWVEFKPGGYHLMLMDLKRPIQAGEKLPLTLVIEGRDKKRRTVEVQAEARGLGQ